MLQPVFPHPHPLICQYVTGRLECEPALQKSSSLSHLIQSHMLPKGMHSSVSESLEMEVSHQLLLAEEDRN